MRWVVVMAVKAPRRSNTRLAPVTRSTEQLLALTLAMRADTRQAIAAAGAVEQVVLVVDEPVEPTGGSTANDGEHLLVQRSPGLNAAIAEGAGYARDRWPHAGTVALVGDLPALRAHELAAALTEAGRHPHAVVTDHLGTGTTMLTAAPGQVLAPRFGIGSAAVHTRQATPLAAGPGLRTDVDTPADLRAAARLGLGARTSALLPHLLLTGEEHDLGHEHH